MCLLDTNVVSELRRVHLMERRDAAQGTVLRQWLEKRVLPAFENRILPLHTDVARCSASLHVPDPRPLRDRFIAATALTHSLVVVTRNVSDFDACGSIPPAAFLAA